MIFTHQPSIFADFMWKNVEKGIDCYDVGLHIDSGDANGWLYKGGFLKIAKKYDEALKILDKIEIMEPTLKYLQTTRNKINKINREQKINSFSNKNDKIDNMTGIEFEKLLTDKFNELNFIATQTKGSGDFGADIIVETSNQTKIIIQCKRFTSKVNLKAVQEVIGAVGHFEADIGIVITNNEFLNSAIKLAKSNDIELWDRAKLAKFLNNDISFSILNEV